MVEAVAFAHEAIKMQCAGLDKLAQVAGKEKLYVDIKLPLEGLQGTVDGRYVDRVDGIYGGGLVKEEQSAATSALSKIVAEEMDEAYPGEKLALKDLMCHRMYEKARTGGTRIGGRRLDKVRVIDADAGLMPSVHRLALFTRGQTRSIATATLGSTASPA